MPHQPSTSRRIFVGGAIAVGASVLAGSRWASHALAQSAKPALADAGAAVLPSPSPSHATLVLPPLPYAENALAPYISANTVALHYGKHHAGYFDKLNTLIAGTPYSGKSLEEIVKASARASARDRVQRDIFNNAAQAWNHNFYWRSMKPGGGGSPTGDLKARINKDFGSYEDFKAKLGSIAVDHFSNGWVWLVLDKGKLKLLDTYDADTPLAHGQKALMGCDLWEHAYYLDYKNARKDYITAFVDHLLNWDFVLENLA